LIATTLAPRAGARGIKRHDGEIKQESLIQSKDPPAKVVCPPDRPKETGYIEAAAEEAAIERAVVLFALDRSGPSVWR
jgi:hypothetical protein